MNLKKEVVIKTLTGLSITALGIGVAVFAHGATSAALGFMIAAFFSASSALILEPRYWPGC